MSGPTEIIYDSEDEAIFQSRKWHINDSGYAVWRGILGNKRQTIRFHRLVIGAKPGEIVDHLNRNRLDNRRKNLRICTFSDNARNRTTRGYTWDHSKQRYMVRYRNKFYGRYDTETQAKRAYQLAKSGVPYKKREHRQKYYLPVGVFKNKSNRGYQARIGIFGERKYLGTFKTIDQARSAYEKVRIAS